MSSVHNLFHLLIGPFVEGGLSVEQCEEAGGVGAGGNVTDNQLNSTETCATIQSKEQCSALRSDHVVAKSGYAFIRIEYKRDASDLTDAVEQLKNNTVWMKTVQNQSPFQFGIVATGYISKIYILTPIM